VGSTLHAAPAIKRLVQGMHNGGADRKSELRMTRQNHFFILQIRDLQDFPLARHMICIYSDLMKTVVSSLYELQQIELLSPSDSSGTNSAADRLRERISPDFLSVYERYRIRGRRAVAVVRNGVCGECHLRIPMGTLVDLMHGDEVMRCGNCGRFLFLPEDAPIVAATTPAPKPAPIPSKSHTPRPRRKKAEVTAQAA
jgi:hypothetical protein